MIHALAQHGLALPFPGTHFSDLTFANFKSVCVDVCKLLTIYFAPETSIVVEQKHSHTHLSHLTFDNLKSFCVELCKLCEHFVYFHAGCVIAGFSAKSILVVPSFLLSRN